MRATRPGDTFIPVDVADGWRGLVRIGTANVAWETPAVDADDWAAFNPSRVDVILKRDASGTVGRARVATAEVVVKRPASPGGTRGLIAPLRQSRASRAFAKTRAVLTCGLPAEVPLALLRRGRERAGIYGFVPGVTLADCDLDALPDRRALFRAIGRVLRRTGDAGWTHLDSKTDNWMVTPFGPVVIDCDGFRRTPFFPRRQRGMRQLLRTLAGHPRHVPADVAWLREGFCGGGGVS